MKLLLLAFLVFLGFAIPDKSVSVKINVVPGPLRKVDRRDTLPPVEMSLLPTDAPKLTYRFDGEIVHILNVKWLHAFGNRSGKYTARINRMTDDGYIAKTLFAGQVPCELMKVIIPHYGIYKIAVFQEGDYCNGIEYDLRWFGRQDVTPISQFNHHLILCQ